MALVLPVQQALMAMVNQLKAIEQDAGQLMAASLRKTGAGKISEERAEAISAYTESIKLLTEGAVEINFYNRQHRCLDINWWGGSYASDSRPQVLAVDQWKASAPLWSQPGSPQHLTPGLQVYFTYQSVRCSGLQERRCHLRGWTPPSDYDDCPQRAGCPPPSTFSR